MEQWIREQYAASAFNCCECQQLPAMHGPPVKIHIQEGVTPVASHSPIPIPLHWHKEVKAWLDRHKAIGVIEKVPSGTPPTWCHRMVCVSKKDNSPRRTVNFMPLNQHSARETHHKNKIANENGELLRIVGDLENSLNMLANAKSALGSQLNDVKAHCDNEARDRQLLLGKYRNLKHEVDVAKEALDWLHLQCFL